MKSRPIQSKIGSSRSTATVVSDQARGKTKRWGGSKDDEKKVLANDGGGEGQCGGA